MSFFLHSLPALPCSWRLLTIIIAATGGAIAAPPVGHWRLNETNGAMFRNSAATGAIFDARIEGPVGLDQAGPAARFFPFLASDTRAAALRGGLERAAILVDDPGDDSVMDIKLGETISLEAWVKVDDANAGGAVLFGKGVARGAQRSLNYGLGVRFFRDMLLPSFGFTPADSMVDGGQEPRIARWETRHGFPRRSGWHHLAITFTFGRVESIRLFLDGVPQAGDWAEESLAIAALAPATNNLPLRIAETEKAAVFRGAVAEAMVHRRELTEAELRRRLAPPLPVVSPGELRADKVRVELREGVPFSHGWIYDTTSSRAVESYEEESLALYRLPQRYVETGVRGDWPNPLLVRAAARVTLPAGRHRFLLRTHSTARLFIDGKLVSEISYRQFDQSGHSPVEWLPDPPTPATRSLASGCRETIVEFDCAGGENVMVLETRVGGISSRTGAALRPELGETLAAVQLAGEDDFKLLGPGRRVPLTDVDWSAFVHERERYYDRLDAERRAQLRDADRNYWDSRHAEARAFVAALPPLDTPSPSATLPEANLVDRFLNAKIERALAASRTTTGTVQFHRDVLPILESNCFSCHGAKQKGELRLDERASAFAGGGSGAPGILPGRPEESEVLRRILTDDPEDAMPAKGDRLSHTQASIIKTWIREGAVWPDEAPAEPVVTPRASELDFIRRVFLDVVGQTPSADELNAFLADTRAEKRALWIDRLLADSRWAEHWVSHWQDLLAENPTLANLTLNVTGPFRWWIHESFVDNKPMDLFATELIAMRGSRSAGGPAGFALAAENDAPMAEKAATISAAFLGTQMKCARCHDAPFHASTQKDLFSLGAMLNEATMVVPKTSSVPASKLARPNALVNVTLAPGTSVGPTWSLTRVLAMEHVAKPLGKKPTTRDELAAAVTSPRNLRFAEVMVNRLWARYFGRGLVRSLDDWERAKCSHPELLQFLAREFLEHGYDLKHVARILLNSRAYQRQGLTHEDSNRLFAAPPRRQMTPEQVVDSLIAAFGVKFWTEPLNLDLHNTREFSLNQSLERPAGWLRPRRAWEFANAPLDRDRPSLMLPRVQAVTDVLTAFGWRGSRVEPASHREMPMNPLQPASLANGTFGLWLVRLSEGTAMTDLALSELSLEKLLRIVFLRVLNRPPADGEMATFTTLLAPGFAQRRLDAPDPMPSTTKRSPVLSWTNHLSPEGNELRLADMKEVRLGPAPTARLAPGWRARFEDLLWALLNSPETIFIP